MTNEIDLLVARSDSYDLSAIASNIKVIAFGNPLLDISIKTTDDEVLTKFKLNPNDQKEVSIEKLIKLTTEAKKRYKSHYYSLGGSSLNSIRILNALGEKNCLFFGAIGPDKNGKILKDILKRTSINVCLQTLDNFHTGSCICLIRGDSRSLTANIGAALHLEQSYIEKKLAELPLLKAHSIQTVDGNDSPQIEPLLNCTLFYIEGFFIPEKMEICKFIYESYCKDSPNLFITNLNAPYIVSNFTKDLQYLVNVSDILFGNKDEFEELASISGFNSMEDLLKSLLADYARTEREKIIIITDGSNPVLIYMGNQHGWKSDFHNVPQIEISEIVDTTGAGDSFVAGFIDAFLKKRPITECVEYGCEISSKVIKVIGCNLPT